MELELLNKKMEMICMELELLNKKIDDAFEELKKDLLNKELTLDEIDRNVFDVLSKRGLVRNSLGDFDDLGSRNFFVDEYGIINKNEFVYAYCFYVKNIYYGLEKIGYNCVFKVKDDLIIEKGISTFIYGAGLKKDTKAVITKIDIIYQ
ncbi:hypothetical protein [Clostridium sp.]|jgi:hypothetical protein|uniref:hypothetical protein n=1 Tax=Clostridium sp. TaxID=1506 RepID=UPI00258515A1|nr:hypothetical protein [Clostridium sp.]MDF2503053.1 hypothetical protein [Clostridium sp.]